MSQHDTAESRNCLTEALQAGFVSGFKASVVSGGLYWLAWTYSPFFRYRFNVSARTALTVLPIFYTGWLNVELTMLDCMKRNSPEYVIVSKDEEADG